MITCVQSVTYPPKSVAFDPSYSECKAACNATCTKYCSQELCEKYGPTVPPLGSSRKCPSCICPTPKK